MPTALETAFANTRAHLLSLRTPAGHWEGELSSSALSTATAIVALHTVDPAAHAQAVQSGARWLLTNANADGGWGDTTLSKSNLSTTLLCWSALNLLGEKVPAAEAWISGHVGSLEPEAIVRAVVARYGKDKTFSVPILMLCAIGGTLGADPWRRVLPLPFELAALPRSWFGAVGLPVVSYALPALIAIGYARFTNAPPAPWNPLRWLRASLWPRIRPMLKTLQPSSGGYLEATPLTSFVTMALAAAGQKAHPCVPAAVEFLLRSMRGDGSWPIDTNLATWGTTLAIKTLGTGEGNEAALNWVAAQQYHEVHPFTNAAPGGWAWTDLPGGVPDADDTAGALIALHHGRALKIDAILMALGWLLNLQNRDGGLPTFCRGWGALPFDRSTPELTAHALLAWWLWKSEVSQTLQSEIERATGAALQYLEKTQRADGSWVPLWFGNEHALNEENPVYGTAQVIAYLSDQAALAQQARQLIGRAGEYLLAAQKTDGSWGGDADAPASIEETAVALYALSCAFPQPQPNQMDAIQRAANWLITATRGGTHFPAAPIGLYFARLWYHEKLYPVIWTLQALRRAKAVLPSVSSTDTTSSPP
jgi:squalene-hopene/tetraprenyl-beta-curcumene cyclase